MGLTAREDVSAWDYFVRTCTPECNATTTHCAAANNVDADGHGSDVRDHHLRSSTPLSRMRLVYSDTQTQTILVTTSLLKGTSQGRAVTSPPSPRGLTGPRRAATMAAPCMTASSASMSVSGSFSK